MKFKGDIIITDPCYIIKERRTDYVSAPQWWDFISQHHKKENGQYREPRSEDYPDCRLKTIEDCHGDKGQKLEIKIGNFTGKPQMYSETLHNEWQKYFEADKQWKKDNIDDWELCGYGENMEVFGIKNYMCRDTLYGDWSCTTFNSDTNEKIGEFCADAGMVAVFLLDEVLTYNPDFDYHINKPWTTTLIKDFEGEVEFVVKHIEGVYEEDTDWWKKGDKWEDDVVEVVGTGNINFIGLQTGY